MADTNPKEFDPSRYLSKVSGNDYLEVKWRVLWLRQLYPNASINTELVSHEDQVAIFKATVRLPDEVDEHGTLMASGGSATGWGQEQYGDFRDYVEKAETKALGRALAALGFGTQFCQDFNFGADQNRVVDAPVDLRRQQQRRQQNGPQQQVQQGGNASEQPATARQHTFIESMARELGISDDALRLECESSFGVAITGLNRRDASVFIERLQQRRTERPSAANH